MLNAPHEATLLEYAIFESHLAQKYEKERKAIVPIPASCYNIPHFVMDTSGYFPADFKIPEEDLQECMADAMALSSGTAQLSTLIKYGAVPAYGYSSGTIDKCEQISADGFDIDAKIRVAWISPDYSKVYFTNEHDYEKALKQFGLIEDIKSRASSLWLNKRETAFHKMDDISYSSIKVGYTRVMCVFKNATITSNARPGWRDLEPKYIISDVVRMLCHDIESITFEIPMSSSSKLYKTFKDFENEMFIPCEIPNMLHYIGKVYHHDRRSFDLRHHHRIHDCLVPWTQAFDHRQKFGYDWIEHATYDTYYPFFDLGRPEQEPLNYGPDRMRMMVPLSTVVSSYSDSYFQDMDISTMNFIKTAMTVAPEVEPLKWTINRLNVMVDLTHPPIFPYG